MKANRKKIYSLGALAVAFIAIIGAVSKKPSSHPSVKTETPKETGSPVEVATAATGVVAKWTNVTGSLISLQDVSLSSKMAGRLSSIYVREGDAVKAGQIVARLDTSDLENQVRSAEGAVASATAKVAQAEAAYNQQLVSSQTGVQSAQAAYNQQKANTNASISAAEAAYEQQLISSRANIESAQSALESARATLSQVKEGARVQEIAQAESRVAVAKTNYKKAAIDAKRYTDLSKEGAIAQVVAEQYESAAEVQREELRSAEQALSLVKEGARSQEVTTAEQNVRQAEEKLRQAKAAAAQDAVRLADLKTARAGKLQDEVKRAALESSIAARAQDNVKRAELQAARANLSQSESSLAIARKALDDGAIVAPVSGQVASRTSEPGQIVSPGTPILRLVSLDAVYFEPSIPDREIGSIRAGQKVDVKVDAFPQCSFQGTVVKIYPAGSDKSRSFPVRIAVENPDRMLRPQMYARGRIETEKHTGIVIIPKDAILTDTQSGKGDASGKVFTVEKGVAHEKPITLGFESSDGKQIEAIGMPAGASIVTSGHRGIAEGTKVTVRKPATTGK